MGVPISLVVAIAVPELLGSIIGRITSEELAWFKTQRKPSWEPPGALFGIAWTVLYAVIGYASWRVWIQGGWQAHQKALSLYVVQLALNLSWPIMFFREKKLGTAQGINLVLLGLAAWTASAFYKVDAFAGKLFLPYLAWLTFANALNYSVWKKNPQPTTGVDDLAKESGMENPGEGRYKIPSASLSSSAFASNQHSRRQTVSVRCSSTAQAVLPVRRHATAAPSRTCARIAVHKLAMPLSTAPGSCRQASMLR